MDCLLSLTLTWHGSCGARHCSLHPSFLGLAVADTPQALLSATSEDEMLSHCVCGVHIYEVKVSV